MTAIIGLDRTPSPPTLLADQHLVVRSRKGREVWEADLTDAPQAAQPRAALVVTETGLGMVVGQPQVVALASSVAVLVEVAERVPTKAVGLVAIGAHRLGCTGIKSTHLDHKALLELAQDWDTSQRLKKNEFLWKNEKMKKKMKKKTNPDADCSWCALHTISNQSFFFDDWKLVRATLFDRCWTDQTQPKSTNNNDFPQPPPSLFHCQSVPSPFVCLWLVFVNFDSLP